MKITHDSADKLILDYTPWILGGILVSLILIAAGFALYSAASGEAVGIWIGIGGAVFGGVFFVLFVRRVQLVLDRPADTATLRRRDSLRDVREEFALPDVHRAEVQHTISSDSDGSTEVTRAALIVTGRAEPVPLTLVYSSGSGADRAADAINGWLDNARARN